MFLVFCLLKKEYKSGQAEGLHFAWWRRLEAFFTFFNVNFTINNLF